VRQGKVRYIGCSNLHVCEVAGSRHISEARGLQPFVSSRNEYSLLIRDAENELVPALSAYGMGLLPYFPLARTSPSPGCSSAPSFQRDRGSDQAGAGRGQRQGRGFQAVGGGFATPNDLTR